MIGIVVVAHSEELARGVCEVASQMGAGEPVQIEPAGGTEDGRIGTSVEKVERALHQVLEEGEGALVLMDLGSAVMITEMAVEALPEELQERVRLSNAPLVEGAIAAVSAAAGGQTLQEVKQAAEAALETPKLSDEPKPETPEAPGEETTDAVAETEAKPTAAAELEVSNPAGLHARPAARFVHTAMAFEADITVQNVTHGRPPANAKSMMEVASKGTAWQGEKIRIEAEGADAEEAIAALKELVESGFGEKEAAEEEPSEAPSPREPGEEADWLRGVGASAGIAIAPAYVHRPAELDIERREVASPQEEVERLHEAIDQAQEELSELQEAVAEEDEETARIFEFQRSMLEDPTLVDAIEKEIKEASCNAEAATDSIIDEWVERFETGEDSRMQLRADDVRDIGNRLLRVLLGKDPESPLRALPEPVIVVAEELTPSDTARLDRENVEGVCTAGGGATSHAAIIARTWGLPAVAGLGKSVLEIADETPLAIDGTEGIVYVDPSPEVIQEFRDRQEERSERFEEAMAEKEQPAVTQDGHQVEVVANIGDVESAEEALEYGAEGVGLLRTEFLYLNRESSPDEAEQFEAYRSIAEVMGERPVIIRTLDIGGDKPLPYLDLEAEMNPFLGVRAIRLTLRRPELFQPQLRAILQAAEGKNVKVMFPLIGTRDEVARAKEKLEEARQALAEEGIPYSEDIEIGIMVETPAAAVQIDQIAPLVDFFSIGSNDLTQYTLACDRGNEELSDLFQDLDPAVLRLIRQVIDAAHAADRWVGLCGQLAGDRRAIPVLLGLGLDEFSMAPRAIPEAKQLIRSLTLTRAREIAEHALSLPTAAEVKEYLDTELQQLEP